MYVFPYADRTSHGIASRGDVKLIRRVFRGIKLKSLPDLGARVDKTAACEEKKKKKEIEINYEGNVATSPTHSIDVARR